MADDKGGGSKSWEPFEVVLVILLLIGLLTQLQKSFGTKKAPSTSPPASHTTTTHTTAASSSSDASTCGLIVTSPHALQKVQSSLEVAGTTDDCNWTSTPNVALFAQVIDAQGNPLSNYTAIPPATTGFSGTAFDATIPLTAMAAGNGYLILLPATPSPSGAITYRIPITFSP